MLEIESGEAVELEAAASPRRSPAGTRSFRPGGGAASWTSSTCSPARCCICRSASTVPSSRLVTRTPRWETRRSAGLQSRRRWTSPCGSPCVATSASAIRSSRSPPGSLREARHRAITSAPGREDLLEATREATRAGRRLGGQRVLLPRHDRPAQPARRLHPHQRGRDQLPVRPRTPGPPLGADLSDPRNRGSRLHAVQERSGCCVPVQPIPARRRNLADRRAWDNPRLAWPGEAHRCLPGPRRGARATVRVTHPATLAAS